MFKLPDLPYAYDALEPTVSAETMRLHHDKHHQAYFDATNKLMEKFDRTPASLEDLVVESKPRQPRKLYNSAAQAWNHTFFWTCMSPKKQSPDGALKAAIDEAFGSMDELKAKFVEEGLGHFASGWVWLIARGGKLELDSTHDAANHLDDSDVTPLLVCDLWEHAYYVDYKNARKTFLESWFDNLPNWAFAAEQYAAATGTGKRWRHPAPEAVTQSAAA